MIKKKENEGSKGKTESNGWLSFERNQCYNYKKCHPAHMIVTYPHIILDTNSMSKVKNYSNNINLILNRFKI